MLLFEVRMAAEHALAGFTALMHDFKHHGVW